MFQKCPLTIKTLMLIFNFYTFQFPFSVFSITLTCYDGYLWSNSYADHTLSTTVLEGITPARTVLLSLLLWTGSLVCSHFPGPCVAGGRACGVCIRNIDLLDPLLPCWENNLEAQPVMVKRWRDTCSSPGSFMGRGSFWRAGSPWTLPEEPSPSASILVSRFPHFSARACVRTKSL